MRGWCESVLRWSAPLVPSDMRAEWLREWRAEFAWAAQRAECSGRGLPPRYALRAVGAIVHAAWLRWDRWRLDMILQDVKHAARSLWRKPTFTAVVALTLAIGIGGTTAIFGAVNAVLLRPLPYPEPDRLVRIYQTALRTPDRIGGAVSPPDFTDWRHDSTHFSAMSALYADAMALTGAGAAEQVPAGLVTGSFFDVLGTVPALGRAIAATDDAVGSRDVVVLGHDLWQRRFGSSTAIVGQQITLDGKPFEVVGVMPPGFSYPLRAQLWVPLRFSEKELQTQRGAHYLEVVGRLKPAVSLEGSRDELRSIAARLARAYPSTNRDSSISVHPLRESMVGSVRQSMLVLLGAVGLVLLIVCVNIAALVLIRAIGRGRELAVRVAIGASRAALVRSLLVETGLLGMAGGIGGVLLAYWATAAIRSMDPSIGVPLLNETRLDWTVTAFALGIALVSAAIVGTLPAWQAASIGEVVTRIRDEGGSTTSDPRRQRLRSMLIVAETTLAVVLLVAAGLLARSFDRLLAVDLGFATGGVQTYEVSLPSARYPQPQQRAEFYEQLIARAAAVPNVESAAAVFGLPLSNTRFGISTSLRDGVKLSDDEQDRLTLQVRIVTPDYFKTLGIRVVRGRGFTNSDRRGVEPVAMLNETGAARVWPDQDPIGHSIEIGTGFGMGAGRAGGAIVGVVADVRDFGAASRVSPTIYLAHPQWPVESMTMVAKARNGDPAALIQPLRGLLRELDSDVPMSGVRSMDEIAATAVAQPRLYLILIGSFALTALLLAAIGLYGVLAYAVGQRTREIGIRLALGAGRSEVLRMVLVQAVRLAVTGVGAGLVVAVLASRLLRAQLFEIAPTDVTTYLVVAVGLLAVAMLASWIPARRAARIDPLSALRHD